MTLPLADLSEKQWQAQVVDLARLLGWHRPMHIFDSRRSEPGWPDLALVRDRLILVELKREKGRLTAAQKRWIGWLLEANVETYVARPADLDDLAAVLRHRGSVWASPAWDARLRLVERTRQETA